VHSKEASLPSICSMWTENTPSPLMWLMWIDSSAAKTQRPPRSDQFLLLAAFDQAVDQADE
jgi:hypothetical protein